MGSLITKIVVLFFFSSLAIAETFPVNAIAYVPLLKQELNSIWPTHPLPSTTAAQIEQETCVRLTSKGCWNPKTELKTSREYGFGFGQITIAYDAKGKERFNNFNEFKKLSSELGSWKWEDRYNPDYQLKALVIVDKNEYNKIKFPTASPLDRLSFSLSSYNGGFGGVLQDVKLCQVTENCDSTKWFNNVALVSFKQKTKIQGYGQSFFDINRGYVDNIMNKRRTKYIPYLEKE